MKNILFYLKKLFPILLLLILLVNFLFRLYSYRQNYIEPFNADFWKNKYLKSQWVVSNSKEGLGDDGLYTYEGWELINGADPTLLNPEVPPLGKYLIGFGSLIFGNRAIFAVITGISSLFFLYLLSLAILKSKLYSLAVVAIFSLEPLFFTQLSAPNLDLLYLTFIFAFLLFLFKKNLVLSGIALGLAVGTKSTITSFILGIALTFIFLFISDKKNIKKIFLLLPISLITLLFVYTKYFLLGHSLRGFLGVQKYVFIYYAIGAKGKFGSFLSMLFLGKWPTWWGTVEKVTEWNIIWPLITIISLAWLIYLLVKNKLGNLVIIFLWVVIYGIFLLFIPVWPRYLLLLLPFFYISFFHLLQTLLTDKLKF